MKFTRSLNGLVLEAECDASLRLPAGQLLDDLSDLHRRGPPLRDGSTVLYGWALLRLRQAVRTLRVEEPDFLGGSIRDYVPGVGLTLKVLDEQARLMRGLDCSPRPTFCTDEVVAARGCLGNADLYLERQAPVKAGDSGWYIGPASESAPGAGELEVIKAYRLITLRPELLVVLALPERYLATFSDGQLCSIIDEKDRRVWSRQDRGRRSF